MLWFQPEITEDGLKATLVTLLTPAERLDYPMNHTVRLDYLECAQRFPQPLSAQPTRR